MFSMVPVEVLIFLLAFTSESVAAVAVSALLVFGLDLRQACVEQQERIDLLQINLDRLLWRMLWLGVNVDILHDRLDRRHFAHPGPAHHAGPVFDWHTRSFFASNAPDDWQRDSESEQSLGTRILKNAAAQTSRDLAEAVDPRSYGIDRAPSTGSDDDEDVSSDSSASQSDSCEYGGSEDSGGDWTFCDDGQHTPHLGLRGGSNSQRGEQHFAYYDHNGDDDSDLHSLCPHRLGDQAAGKALSIQSTRARSPAPETPAEGSGCARVLNKAGDLSNTTATELNHEGLGVAADAGKPGMEQPERDRDFAVRPHHHAYAQARADEFVARFPHFKPRAPDMRGGSSGSGRAEEDFRKEVQRSKHMFPDRRFPLDAIEGERGWCEEGGDEANWRSDGDDGLSGNRYGEPGEDGMPFVLCRLHGKQRGSRAGLRRLKSGGVALCEGEQMWDDEAMQGGCWDGSTEDDVYSSDLRASRASSGPCDRAQHRAEITGIWTVRDFQSTGYPSRKGELEYQHVEVDEDEEEDGFHYTNPTHYSPVAPRHVEENPSAHHHHTSISSATPRSHRGACSVHHVHAPPQPSHDVETRTEGLHSRIARARMRRNVYYGLLIDLHCALRLYREGNANAAESDPHTPLDMDGASTTADVGSADEFEPPFDSDPSPYLTPDYNPIAVSRAITRLNCKLADTRSLKSTARTDPKVAAELERKIKWLERERGLAEGSAGLCSSAGSWGARAPARMGGLRGGAVAGGSEQDGGDEGRVGLVE